MKGGGLKAIIYTLKASKEVGLKNMFKALHSRNACKSCALGMGGQRGGMVDETGSFPEVCKKSFQAQMTDIQPPIPDKLFNDKSIEDLKQTSPRLLEKLGRLNTPLHKADGDSHYSPISWEKALQIAVDRFKSVDPDRSFFYSSGRSSNEAAFLLQLYARMYGTNNVNNCSYYCHQASGVGIGSTLGTGTATVVLDDLEKSDLIFVIGANPASNHPRFISQLLECLRRGGEVIVINPAREGGLVKFAIPSDFRSFVSGGSEIASHYVQVNIGGDIALLKGIAKAVVENGSHDIDFINNYTNGHQEFLEDLKSCSWQSITENSGISEERIRRLAEIYGSSKNVIFSWSMGITHHKHGVDNVESIVNLALLRGMVGRRHAGLLPLRGHSNIQGVGSVGVTPALKRKIFENIEGKYGIKLPETPGMDTMACMQASLDGNVDLAFILGGNLYGATPDSLFAEKALNTVPFKVFLNTTLNQSHFYGVEREALILPVAARDEEKQKTTQESMFNFVRMSDGGIVRLDNVRSEVDIVSEIAHHVLGEGKINFGELNDHSRLRQFIANTVPGFEKLGEIDKSGEEFQIGGRTFHEPKFPTSDSKAIFKTCAIPQFDRDNGEFLMMTVRSEGQFNSIIYDEEDVYRDQTSRWIVMMNEADIKNRGLQENDKVTLESSAGKMVNVAVRKFDIPPGNIITYYPESNVLVPTDTDPRSLTPAYKSVRVNILTHSSKNVTAPDLVTTG